MNSNEPHTLPPGEAAQLTRSAKILRLGIIGLVLGGIAGLFLYAGGWFSPQALSPAAIVNRFETLNGKHPGFRRNHTKGVCISGFFEANGRGVAWSRAAVFPAGRIPVIGRFALAVGMPYAPDAEHTVRSLALSFKLPDGEEWRTGMNNIPVFPVNSAAGFYDLLLASAPDPATHKPNGEKMGAFLGKHPESGNALKLILNQPSSSGFADSAYNSLNTFRFINASGVATPVRWSMAPAQPFTPFNATNVNQSNSNFLFDALIADVQARPLQWHLILTIGKPGDSTADATLPWPSDRVKVDAGTLTINQVESEDTSPARDLNFDPLLLPDGIAGSDDPLLSVRSATYSQSFTRREGERKYPSAVSATESTR